MFVCSTSQHPAQPHPDPSNINQENMLGRGKNMLEAEMMMFLWVEVVQYYDIGVWLQHVLCDPWLMVGRDGAEERILLPFKGVSDIEEILCNFLHPSIKPPTIDKTFVPINKLLYNNRGIWIFSISQNNGEETNEIWIF